MLGVNADGPRHGFSAEDIAASGCQAVRFPALLDPSYAHWWVEVEGNGMTAIPVITNEIFTAKQIRGWDFRPSLMAMKELYPTAHIIQVGNEPDNDPELAGSETSSILNSRAYYHLTVQARATFGPQVQLIGAGLVSGNPKYLDGVSLRNLDAIALHPYTQTADSIRGLVNLYRRFPKPIWVTELGDPAEFYEDEHERAEAITDKIIALRRLGIHNIIIYAWSDLMGGGMGLVDAEGNPKESLAAFTGAL